VLPEIVASGTPAVRKTVFSYQGGDSVTVSIRPTPRVDALYAPRRLLIDRVLVDAALEAGVDVHHDVTATHLLHRPGRVAGVTVRDRHDRQFDIRARFVVGADGIRSMVAAETGAEVVHQGSAASAVLYRYVTGRPTKGYEWAYGDGAAAGLIPTNDDQTCVFVSTTVERMKALRRNGAESAFSSLVAAVEPRFLERIEAAEDHGRLHGWGGVAGFVRRASGPGWALVGDAGHFKDPITTHGMTDGMRDAELLSSALVAALDGHREAEALAEYEATRDRLSAQLWATTEAVAAYAWDIPEIQRLLRQVSSAMSDEVDHLQALPDCWPTRSSVAARIAT
jgi:flavin-dependent dehydrogenase